MSARLTLGDRLTLYQRKARMEQERADRAEAKLAAIEKILNATSGAWLDDANITKLKEPTS
jgi:hypothetical protein